MGVFKMPGQSARFKNWGTPERIAAWAGSLGFALSVILLSLYFAAGNSADSGMLWRTSLENLSVLLWPSAFLLAGAQTLRGGIVLFLLSASLNAGYYVFISLSGYLVCHKLEVFTASSRMLQAAPVRVYHAPRLIQHVPASRSFN